MKKIERQRETAKEWKSLYPSPFSDTLFLPLTGTTQIMQPALGQEHLEELGAGAVAGQKEMARGQAAAHQAWARGLRNSLSRQEWSEGVSPISQGWGKQGGGREGLLSQEEVWGSCWAADQTSGHKQFPGRRQAGLKPRCPLRACYSGGGASGVGG